MKKIPKVFVSYSHDSQKHKKWVLDFATRLRYSGIDAILDQWELKPGDDLPHFMETNLENSDYVLMVCTSRYVKKANSGMGGVGYEKMIITSSLMRKIDSNKIIPIIRQNSTIDLPIFLKTKLFINFSREEDFEFNFDELLRTLHSSQLFTKPDIGDNPFTLTVNDESEKMNSALKKLMGVIVNKYEENNLLYLEDIFKQMNISRIYFDLLVREAEAKELISIFKCIDDIADGVKLEYEGKIYAIKNKIIKDSVSIISPVTKAAC